jgi:hypothetical protein
MVKKLLLIIIAALFTFSVPALGSDQNIKDEWEDVQNPKVNITESTIYVSGAVGMTLQIYNVTGVSVAKVKIDSAEKRIELNLPKGCYILKIGKVVRKIYIK